MQQRQSCYSSDLFGPYLSFIFIGFAGVSGFHLVQNEWKLAELLCKEAEKANVGKLSVVEISAVLVVV